MDRSSRSGSRCKGQVQSQVISFLQDKRNSCKLGACLVLAFQQAMLVFEAASANLLKSLTQGPGAWLAVLVKYKYVLTGGIAQLEEHLLCKQGVGGSSPPTSTNLFKGLG
jgi:hypothetical protein